MSLISIPAPLDPNFTGAGRAQTDSAGYYKIHHGQTRAYPWGNHYNAWRPAHITSRCSATPSSRGW